MSWTMDEMAGGSMLLGRTVVRMHIGAYMMMGNRCIMSVQSVPQYDRHEDQ
jgi:hypothetical protein